MINSFLKEKKLKIKKKKKEKMDFLEQSSFKRFPLKFNDKFRFILLLGVLGHISMTNFCCLGLFVWENQAATRDLQENGYDPFIIYGCVVLALLSFICGFYTDRDRKHQHRGLQFSSIFLLVSLAFQVLFSGVSTKASHVLLIVYNIYHYTTLYF